MEATTIAVGFGQRHFGKARLGDKRRTRRLVKTADQIMQHPAGSLPEKLPQRKDLVALYRLLDEPQVTHQRVLQPHLQQTLEAMRQHQGVVLLVHDTTELDFSHCTALAQQLGQIGHGGNRGLLCHNSLAITPERQVLGLASQILHKRRQVPKGEPPLQKRQHPDRESRLWVKAVEAIGPAPTGCRWVDICDRGSDTWEYLAYEIRHGRQFVIRCAKDRNLQGPDHLGSDRIYLKLHGYARDLPVQQMRTVQVPAVPGKHAARVAQVGVAFAPVTLEAPHFVRGEAEEESLQLWVVAVRELDAPAGVRPLEWLLLSNVPVQNVADASQRVDWYACRPVVEEYHKAKKTGVQIESLQLEQVERLKPAIALLSVVAVGLLQLRELARQKDSEQTPAREILPELYVVMLSLWRWDEPRLEMSVKEFCLALGAMGGHQNRRRDGLPGWLTLWRGWQSLTLMVKGAQALQLFLTTKDQQRCV
jgi:hypothetical protein